jgi:hypothetical protein
MDETLVKVHSKKSMLPDFDTTFNFKIDANKDMKVSGKLIRQISILLLLLQNITCLDVLKVPPLHEKHVEKALPTF